MFNSFKPNLNQHFSIPFLQSFDISKFRKELINKTDLFGIGTVFWMKRCFWFLLKTIGNLFLTLLIFVGLMAATYYQFYEKSYIVYFLIVFFYWIFAFQWIWVTMRKLLSSIRYDYTVYFLYNTNYDAKHPNPELKFILEEEAKLGVFLQHSMIAFVWQIIVSLCSILIAFVFFNAFQESNMWLSAVQVVLNAYFLYLMYRVFRRIIDFEMDFSIITPESITTFSQAGLTSAKDKTLKHNQIKSITREQEWWIKTFFDFGEIHIKWIWDDTNAKASIILNHVRNADRVKDMIAQVQRGSLMFENPNTTKEEKKEFWYKLANIFYKNKIPQYVIDFFNS